MADGGGSADPPKEEKPGGDVQHINIKVKGQVRTVRRHGFGWEGLTSLSRPCHTHWPMFKVDGHAVHGLLAITTMLCPSPGVSRLSRLECSVQDGNEVFFKIKRQTQFRKLMQAYCERQAVDMNAVAFLFDGQRLVGTQTPDDVCPKPYESVAGCAQSFLSA